MPELTSDGLSFYLDGEFFIPTLSRELASEANTVIIELSAGLHDALDWSEQRQRALKAQEERKHVFWVLSLGFKKGFPWKDEAIFLATSLALTHFTTTLLTEFQELTIGVSLYQDTANFLELFDWNDEYQEEFESWYSSLKVKELWPQDSEENTKLLTLFCSHLFVTYLARLRLFLPYWVTPFLWLDVSDFHCAATLAQLFSQDILSSFFLALKGSSLPFFALKWESGEVRGGYIETAPSVLRQEKEGICLFSPEYFSPDLIDKFNAQVRRLQGTAFRLLSEETLHQTWDGLETIFAFEKGITATGKRKLAGFIAAGGQVEWL